MNTPTNDDIREEILLHMLDLKHRLNLMSKVQVTNGEQIAHEELNALFNSFSKDMNQIIDSFQSIV